MRHSLALLLSCGIAGTHSQALRIDWQDESSIRSGVEAVALGMTSLYTGYLPGDVPGNVPDPYHWWHAGAMFGALIDYWHYTRDDQFNAKVTQGLLHQVGPAHNFMPPNQTNTLGNDDQGFWGMTAMSAAENGYPDSPNDGDPSWLSLAQAVFNTQYPRWNNKTCGGGLHWQIFSFNKGYPYKNTISMGSFFNIAARLGRYTRNGTYIEWAEKAWEWTEGIGLISDDYQFYDGTDSAINCSDVNHIQWTYNAGIFLHGVAALWNHTVRETGEEDNVWKTRLSGIIDGLDLFFFDDSLIIYEQACEPRPSGPSGQPCNIDQRSFKAYLSRWMHSTTKLAPWTRDRLDPILLASRQAAAQACVLERDTVARCGLRWTTGAFEEPTGIGENMAALEVMLSALGHRSSGPVTVYTGGTSKSNPAAGQGSGTGGGSSGDRRAGLRPVTVADKAGAAILTVVFLVGLMSGAIWLTIK